MKLEKQEDLDDLYNFSSSPVAAKSRSGSPSSDANGHSANGRRSEKQKMKEEEGEYKPALIWNLPEARKEAMNTFIELEDCTYQNKSLGASRQLEDSMLCECRWDPSDPEAACGVECINRLTQVECIKGDCKCRSHCLNQRFQRRQYAQLDIVQTEKKGYGVRTARSLTPDTFIYEYIGEVIPHNTFTRRIKEYADDGIEHFYFMQLQRDEYIDATRKGGIGRFLNHSCRPNCYVAKWVVGKKMRMGIFAKRDILAGEELTFNYNVDRYGHDAQECYCGESNCVGFIGGKTQTDIGAMDDLYLEALGIANDVEAFGLKGSKKRKGKKLDEDYVPVLQPIQLSEAPKVASAIRQAASIKRILTKLLARVQMTTEAIVQRQMLRLHGISLMGNLLNEYESDIEVIAPVLEILLGWPMMTRNKVVSSNIEGLIEKLTLNEDEAIAVRAQELVKFWAGLELGYRIPKAVQEAVDAASGQKRQNEDLFETLAFKRARVDQEPAVPVASVDAPRFEVAAATVVLDDLKRELPAGWQKSSADGVTRYYNESTMQMSYTFPTPEIVAKLAADWKAQQASRQETVDVNDVLKRARQQAEERERIRLAEEAAQAAEKARLKAAKAEKAKRKEEAKQKAKAKAERKKVAAAKKRQRDPAKDKEKALMRAFGSVVVNTMSRYKSQLDVDQFKRRAKEITQLLVEKEKKSSSFEKETYASLSKDKTAKVRKFVDDYVQKLLARKSSQSSTSKPSTPAKAVNGSSETPASPDKTIILDDAELEMVKELAGGDDEELAPSEDEEDAASEMEQSDDEHEPESPGTTPSSGAQQPSVDKAPSLPIAPAGPGAEDTLSVIASA